ncbi:MAG: Ig domain-containing protein [Promethearchaeota archaeon]
MKKAATLLMITLVFAPFFVTLAVPIDFGRANDGVSQAQKAETTNIFEMSEILPRDVRIALYDEPDLAQPAYSHTGMWTNNITLIENMLLDAGFSVTRLRASDISTSDILRTANFDVFVMVDNNPRDNITRQVMDFWRGGGGLLSFDGAVSFLCYFGVMVPASLNDHGHGTYWTYDWSQNHTVYSRHPVSQSYQIGDIIIDELDWAAFDWSSLQGFPYSSEYHRITHTLTSDNWVTTLARDTERGGRVVQTFGDCNPIAPAHEQMIIDAINWLCPTPKARIAFDYSHRPYYGIDQGDPDLGYSGASRYGPWRDAVVNRSYTVDKLYKSPMGNLTADRLEPYDMLVINTPLWNFTAAEVQAVADWVAGGGGLVAMGEATGFSEENINLNYLLSNFDLNLSSFNYEITSFTTTSTDLHPTGEGVTTTYWSGGTYVNVTGDAYPIWYDGFNVVVAAQEYGLGRVILTGDINALGNYFYNDDNMAFAVGIANWITSGDTGILVYADGIAGPNGNFYTGPVASALNELGLKFMMTNDRDFFNLSLQIEVWDLLIIDANSYAPATSHSMIRDHLEAGGKVIWRDFMFRYSDPQYAGMWNYLGFSGNDTRITSQPPTVYPWDAGHPIFNMPIDYGASNFTTASNLLNTDWCAVTLLGNATALAGITPTETVNNSAIALGVEGRALINLFAISQYFGDLDDSTYDDNYELWINEIAFMMKPTIDSPVDVEYEEGTTGHVIEWNPSSVYPSEYEIKQDGTPVASQPWDGGLISINVDGLAPGSYTYLVTVTDFAGFTATDTVMVTVTEAPVTTPTTTTTTTTTTTDIPLDATTLIIIAAAAGALIIIIIIVMMKKKK